MDVLKVHGRWRIRERSRATGVVVAERVVENLWTNYGLTALSSAIGGGYVPPYYLVIDNNYTTLSNGYASGVSSVQTAARVDQAGDTQIVLGAGLASQEAVTFSSVTGSGPYTYNFSGTTANAHSSGDPVCRQVVAGDTMGSVVSEQQYDSTNFPNQRMQSPGGYSGGTGNWTIQFYFPGTSAVTYFMICGLADTLTVGTGNLHNHFILGFNHTDTTNDVEVDGSLTLTN